MADGSIRESGFTEIRRKLDYLREEAAQREETRSSSLFTDQHDWERLDEYLYRRRQMLDIPLGFPADCVLLSHQLTAGGHSFSPEDLLFYDTETTGLSTGAGSMVFLVGMAWFENASLMVEQVFLSDFPGEPQLIDYLAEALPERRVYVSFNGKAFDSHMLKSRFLMNGRQWDTPFQVDLLHLCRRFWRRIIGSCSLDNVEREVLETGRDGDITGDQVPDIYFQYLRSGNADGLPMVFQHNLQDTVTLVHLFNLIDRMLAGGELPRMVDRAALGRYLLDRKNPSGIRHLAQGHAEGDQAASKLLGLLYKRQNRWQDALDVWRSMAEKRSIEAMVEMAKYFEHKAKELSTALHWTIEALGETPPGSPLFPDLIKRRERLQRKIARKFR